MEYFIFSHSFAAPFFSDESSAYVKADSPREALRKFANSYDHPCGLYWAGVWTSSDAKNKGEKALAEWKSNRLIEQQRATRGMGSFSICGLGPGKFRINDKEYTVDNPTGGRVFATRKRGAK